MVNRNIIEYLIADHCRLHALLTDALAETGFEPRAFAEFRAGLLRHIAIEEKVLFPAVRKARGGLPLDQAHELRIDHAALTSLLVPTPDLALCREVLTLLSEHDAKEEGPGGIYEECQSWLTTEELTNLAERAESFPEVRVAKHFDGPNAYRTREEALAPARHIPAPTKVDEP